MTGIMYDKMMRKLRQGGNEITTEDQSNLTNEQRIQALANISDQTANANTGKMGYKVLLPGKTFAEQVTEANTIYEIRDVFDLGGTEEAPVSVTIPDGSVLKFNGGKLRNCYIVGNNTLLEGSLDITNSFVGSFLLNKDISPVDFGLEINNDTIDAAPFLAKCFELSSVSNVGVVIPRGNIYLMSSVDVSEYTTLSIKGEGRKSIVNVYYDFLASSRSVETVANIRDFTIRKVNGKGDGYYKGIVFKDFEFTGSEINNLTVRYFGIFIKGGLHVNTVIENCNVSGLGYSFLSCCACEDFENDTLHDGQVSMDSCIMNNYINCAVRGSATNPLPNNRSLIYGNFTSTRFESNFCDYWKCIFDLYSYSSSGRFKANSIQGNFFDRIFSCFIHPINCNDIIISNNEFYACKKENNLDGNWSSSIDQDVIDAIAWCMFKLNGNTSNTFVLKNNIFEADIIASITSSDSTSFADVIADVDTKRRIIYYPTNTLINYANLGDDKILYNKIIYCKDYDIPNIFALTPYLVYGENNVVSYRFGDGFYDFKTTLPLLGCYAPFRINTNYATLYRYSVDEKYTEIEINGIKRLVTVDKDSGNITGILSQDIFDIISNTSSLELTFSTTVRLMDKGVRMTNLQTGNPYCRSCYYSKTNYGNYPLIVSTLPSSGKFINRLIFNTSDNKWYRFTYDGWVEDSGIVPIKAVGTSQQRPQPYWRESGTVYYDTTLSAYIQWNGESWVYEDSGYPAVARKGNITSRPTTLTIDDKGFQYYDTELNQSIIWNGSTWVNPDGSPLQTHTITNTLASVTNSNPATSIDGNKTYMATLTPELDYVIQSVTVTMGGTDVTSFVYNPTTHVIYIASVTGDIVITATAGTPN